ncbi:MAG TPA: epimerase [Candidatus Hydrogenedentes bacterium]|nr:epimerase [Candidatus Hydrogenedentota bacterium]HOT50113.1 epimerase [Candidatus Hydrogenedentota bacterium]HPC17894.1 epimerase [Candidatus Hydrogenedentota bacterium]HRT21247.1 epimerase [Candidatus Hydrogenedentota bacterium]HRT65109.1 epimerase [Candidatus Hydrogenedentota bacterium]
MAHGDGISNQEELEDRLSRPPAGLVESFRLLEGDILILGAGGKMGPSLARMAARAREASGVPRKITAVSSFSTPGLRERIESSGVETIRKDLLEAGAFAALPEAENVMYMVGRKFGSTGAEWQTWATNVYVAGLAGHRFKDSRVVAFSSGNVYPFVPAGGKGATETTPPGPVGEYAITCLGRERMFDYCAREWGGRVLHLRLNYAVELRYGVIVDVALNVWNDIPVDVTMGYFNCVWQSYANAVALQCFALADSPARILNVTGPETISVRQLALRLGEYMGKTPVFIGQEAPDALLSDASECHRIFGLPEVDLERLIAWTADWVMRGGSLLHKPTHFSIRDGRF